MLFVLLQFAEKYKILVLEYCFELIVQSNSVQLIKDLEIRQLVQQFDPSNI
jgi:hypothetical protein